MADSTGKRLLEGTNTHLRDLEQIIIAFGVELTSDELRDVLESVSLFANEFIPVLSRMVQDKREEESK